VYGRTPLENASIQGHEGGVSLLQERENLSPDRPNDCGRALPTGTPTRGQEGVARPSLEQENADLNRPDEDYLTLLTNAAIKGQEEVATLSLELENSNLNRTDSDETMAVETPNAPARIEGRRDRWRRHVLFWK